MFSGSQNSYKNSHRQLTNCINKTPQHDVRTLKIIIITAIVVSLFVSVYFFRYAIMFSVLDLVYFDVSLVLLFIYVSVWHAFCLSVCVCVCIALRMLLCVSLIRRVCCCHQYGFISSSSSLLLLCFCCAFFEYNFSSFSYCHPSSQFYFTISIDMHILWDVYEIRFSFNPTKYYKYSK